MTPRTSTPSNTASTRASARGWSFASVAGIVALQLFGSGWLVVGLVSYLVRHGNATPPTVSGRKADLFAHDWIGYLPTLPWWFFLLQGALVLVVAIATRAPERRFAPTGRRAILLFRTTPGFLTGLALVHAVWQYALIGYYDGLVTVLSPYGWGILLCLAAAIVSFVGYRRDAPGAIAQGTARARVLANALVVVLVGFLVLGPLLIVVNQLVWLSGHEFVAPAARGARNSGLYVWQGLLPFPLSWWVLPVLALAMLVIVLATWPPAARWGAGARTLRRTTSGALVLYSLALGVLGEGVIRYYSSGGIHDPAALGVAIAVLAGLLALVRWLLDLRRPAPIPRQGHAKAERKVGARG